MATATKKGSEAILILLFAYYVQSRNKFFNQRKIFSAYVEWLQYHTLQKGYVSISHIFVKSQFTQLHRVPFKFILTLIMLT